MKKGDIVIMANRAYLGNGTVVKVDKEGVAVLWDRRDRSNDPIIYEEKALQLAKK